MRKITNVWTIAVVLGIVGTLLVLSAGNNVAIAKVDHNIPGSSCKDLPSHSELADALADAQDPINNNGGFNLNMWGTIVNRDGVVCAVAFTGENRGDQWPGSRVISAQKANTANSFSLPGLALSTANLFTAVQPGNSLFGLQDSNPVDTNVAYGGNSKNYGQHKDPMVNRKIGGVNVFGGGLALYNSDGEIVGAIGVSGDTSCADHNISWRTRNNLGLDFVPQTALISNDADRPDNIVFDTETTFAAWGHATCLNLANELGIKNSLPTVSVP
jgi:uncharacterized protein GlcG (DUF336 family)